MVWKESVANCNIAKQSLAWYSVEWVCGHKSGFKGLFSKLKRINIQHWPWCQSSMSSATLKTELGNLISLGSRHLGTPEAPTEKIHF
jgi:hypothetical protein